MILLVPMKDDINDTIKYTIKEELTFVEDVLLSQKHARFGLMLKSLTISEPPHIQSIYTRDCSLMVHPSEVSHRSHAYFCVPRVFARSRIFLCCGFSKMQDIII